LLIEDKVISFDEIKESSTIPESCIMVIFGATGDLTRRMLMPSLFQLYAAGLLSDEFTVIGFSRKEIDHYNFRKSMSEGIHDYGDAEAFKESIWDKFKERLYYINAEFENLDSFLKLKQELQKHEKERKTGGNRLLYMAVPPAVLPNILDKLGQSGLNEPVGEKSWTRIILEKPFGHDLESALELNQQVSKYFSEEQIYRIDHYLGKESVQNILVTRFANGIFEPLWNRNYIDHVEITSAESIGIENRGSYYDKAGALRDVVQNHLLQVMSYIAMEPPATFNPNSIRDESVKVFQSVRPIRIAEVENIAIRGQYTSSVLNGNKIAAYREEKNIEINSRTETYVAVKFHIDNWRWGGVPFYIRTGKRLPTKVTEIVIHFKSTPHHLFKRREDIAESYNVLVIRIQPDEGILIRFAMKVPGAEFKVQNVSMDFHYTDLKNEKLPNAYDRLLLDCMLGDSTLFIRADEVEASWKIIQPILDAWEKFKEIKIYGYPAGTWGPSCSDDIIAGRHFKWRYPCRNVVDDDGYCEL